MLEVLARNSRIFPVEKVRGFRVFFIFVLPLCVSDTQHDLHRERFIALNMPFEDDMTFPRRR